MMTFWIRPNLGTCDLSESAREVRGVVIVDVQDLNDGPENVYKIKKKIMLVIALMRVGFKVVIRCAGGISRSNAIACAVLCVREHIMWEDAEKIIREKVPRTMMDYDFIDCVKETLKFL